MTRKALITRAFQMIEQLPDEQIQEIADFINFVNQRYEENQLSNDILVLTEQSQSFNFLNHEADLYTESDLIEVFGEER